MFWAKPVPWPPELTKVGAKKPQFSPTSVDKSGLYFLFECCNQKASFGVDFSFLAGLGAEILTKT